MQSKSMLRQHINERKKEWSQSFLSASNRKLEQQLLALWEWQNASVLFTYVSIATEPDTRGIIQASFDAGKRIAVPACKPHGRMFAREIHSLSELIPKRFGLFEPDETAPLVHPEEIDLAIVPCATADRRGFRLGHGGGYYDRYLPQLHCPTVCLCRENILLDAVATEVHDVPCSIVLTENQTLRIPL